MGVWRIFSCIFLPKNPNKSLSFIYPLSLLFTQIHIIESSLGSWNYFSRIDQYILLGGIPMTSLDHLSVLSLDHQVQAVLAVNESYELLAVTLAGSPVSPGEWKVRGGGGGEGLIAACILFSAPALHRPLPVCPLPVCPSVCPSGVGLTLLVRIAFSFLPLKSFI